MLDIRVEHHRELLEFLHGIRGTRRDDLQKSEQSLEDYILTISSV